ncbi:MAG: hypothetical protein EPO07_19395, partial [Verrucomicrobia bacterium]
VNIGTGGNTELAGTIELHGDCLFNVGGTSLTISGLITGDGGLIKNGGSPLILTNVNTYTGDTRLNTGVMRLNGNGSITGSSNITLVGGTTLSVTGRVDSTLTLVAGQALKGNGTVNGTLIAGANSTVSPGLDAIGALTVSNAVTLLGTTTMELNGDSGTNDVLRSDSSITYGGTLSLTNLGGPLTNGASFKLFRASSYTGTFSSLAPTTPGPGQAWNTNALSTTGTISVVGPATIGSITLSGSTLVISGSNGVPLGTYYMRASTNVTVPLTNWTRIATNTFTPSGNFSFTNIITSAFPMRFFALEMP